MYIPKGYGTVFPYMIVDCAEELTKFLSTVFGASVEGKTVFPNGRVANIRVRIGTSAFMISEASENTMQAMPGTYYIYVEDVDRTFRAALENGGEKIFEPTDMPYKDRQAGVTDPSGNLWWISRRLVEEPYDD
ncbi:MAG: VOC family protein [Phormidesmis sp. RL_2_1]|nr:VOC family protein [Phormidesmis sp. RL_2_1]